MRIVSSTLIIFWILPSILCGLYDRNACKLYRNCACNRQKTAFCKYRIALEAIQFIKYKNTTLTQKQSLNSVKNWQRYSGFCACLYALPLCLGGKVHSTFFPLRAYLHKYSIYFPRVEGVRCSHSLVIAFLGTRTPLSLYYIWSLSIWLRVWDTFWISEVRKKICEHCQPEPWPPPPSFPIFFLQERRRLTGKREGIRKGGGKGRPHRRIWGWSKIVSSMHGLFRIVYHVSLVNSFAGS